MMSVRAGVEQGVADFIAHIHAQLTGHVAVAGRLWPEACCIRVGKLESDVIHRMLAGVNVDK
jgi:hypothetical protein